ncbi:lipoprotein insertase outer membrane protein LolB [Pseudidiomarina homiensis]|uniref:Outer-membrane lipoprotein LolB n=1 Tax=Pseudidiomarina homiensis TaxID=364198 RepID=A0A432Y4Z2_9GAMM|nr:lipoprotein insertase outer membrane protein LolB [Pseudidiomarina homiensis]RUO56007.1 outer membrane lipoprotein LolB [Pseudidiomarina homiensis]
MKLRLLLLFSLILTGCAAPPEEIPMDAIDANAVARHQAQVDALQHWQLRGQIALFNLTADERDAVYLEWKQSPERLQLRFYHPLKGTLARLEQDAQGATYYDEDEQAYYGYNAESLVARLFNFELPIMLLQQVIVGGRPQGAEQQRYLLLNNQELAVAPLMSYLVTRNEQQWQVQLNNYEQQSGQLFLPHNVELRSSTWRIKLRVSEWKL